MKFLSIFGLWSFLLSVGTQLFSEKKYEIWAQHSRTLQVTMELKTSLRNWTLGSPVQLTLNLVGCWCGACAMLCGTIASWWACTGETDHTDHQEFGQRKRPACWTGLCVRIVVTRLSYGHSRGPTCTSCTCCNPASERRSTQQALQCQRCKRGTVLCCCRRKRGRWFSQ